jgi:hypothetical protein
MFAMQLPYRRLALSLVALAALLLPLAGCGWDGHFSILGYTTQPMYDLGIRSVRLPIFKNTTMRRGIEFDLTEAVKNQILSKTPYRIVQNCDDADTELIGTIIGRSKAVINFNQLGETREAETTLTVEVVWRDLRPGHYGDVLSRPLPGKPGDPLPPPPPLGAPVPPVIVQSLGSFIPELGGSLTTAEKQNVDRLAVQIVSMMEKPF